MSEYRIPIARPWLPPFEHYADLVRELWTSRQLSNNGPYVDRLEEMAGDYLGRRVLAVSSGDAGLIITIAALALPYGTQVLVPSFTFQSTINALIWNRLEPVFVDIDPQTLCIAEPEVRQARAGGVRAVLSTAVFGAMPRPEWDDEPIRDEGLGWCITDAAHAFGAREADGAAVPMDDVAVYSLSGTKVVTSAEGGLIAIDGDDAELLNRMRLIRNYGFLGDYDAQCRGINGKMSELHAALGLLTLPHVDRAVEIRAAIAGAYRQRLSALPGVTFQVPPKATRSAWKDFAVLFADATTRAKVAAALDAAGIQTKRYFRPLHQQTGYRGFAKRPLPVTEDVHARLLCLPMFEEMTHQVIREVCDVVEKAVLA